MTIWSTSFGLQIINSWHDFNDKRSLFQKSPLLDICFAFLHAHVQTCIHAARQHYFTAAALKNSHSFASS